MFVEGWSGRYEVPGRRSRSGWRSRPDHEKGHKHLLSRKPRGDAAVELGEGDHGVRAAARPHGSLGSVLNPSPMSKFDMLFAPARFGGGTGETGVTARGNAPSGC